MADAKYVFMKIVAPLMGFLIANVMFFSGVPGFLERKRLGELGDFNPLPYPVILANCASWIAYSLYIDDYFLFFANAPGMLVGVYFTMVGYGLSPYGGKTRDAIERWTVGLVGALLALTLYVGLVAKKESDGHKQTTIGLFCNAVLLVYYASPLTTIKEVLEKRDASSLYWPISCANIVNGMSWATYGLALNDWLLFAPNAVGAALGASQMALIRAYPSRGDGGGAGGERLEAQRRTSMRQTPSTTDLLSDPMGQGAETNA
jgi:solute carrier family 50 protein (sugar transporter)